MPSLIVVRGNSGSGKSSVAEGLRAEYGPGVAWIEQDRHLTRAKASAFSVEEMRTWYHDRDLLGHASERVIDETSSLRQTIETIAGIAGLQRVC